MDGLGLRLASRVDLVRDLMEGKRLVGVSPSVAMGKLAEELRWRGAHTVLLGSDFADAAHPTGFLPGEYLDVQVSTQAQKEECEVYLKWMAPGVDSRVTVTSPATAFAAAREESRFG